MVDTSDQRHNVWEFVGHGDPDINQIACNKHNQQRLDAANRKGHRIHDNMHYPDWNAFQKDNLTATVTS